MGLGNQKRFLSWLSQLDEAEPVISQEDNHPSARFTFDGIPLKKQTLDTNRTSQQRYSRTTKEEQTRLEPESFQQSRRSTRPGTIGTDSYTSRKEKNGYERIPRPRTKEDRYEYKGKNSRVKATAQKKKASKQMRKNTINEDFHASNVPRNRLTLHSALKLGIFNRGKTSSPINCRVLNPGFSDAEILSKGAAYMQENRPLQQSYSERMFEYDTKIGYSCQDNKPRAELLRPSVEDSYNQHPSSPNIGIAQDTAALCHGSEGGHTQKADALTVPPSLLSNHSPQAKQREEPRQRVIACSQAEENIHYSVPDLAGESCAMQLLDFDLRSSNESFTVDPAKKYWTLEELKHLLNKRIPLWRPQNNGTLGTRTPSVQQSSRKREHPSCEDKDTMDAELPKKRKVYDGSPKFDCNLADRSTSPPTRLLGSCPFPDGPIRVSPDNWFLSFRQIEHAMEKGFSQPQQLCRDRGAGSMYKEDTDTSFISQAFDAAYEAIMRSEQGTPYDLLEHVMMENDRTGNNEVGIALDLQASLEWGVRDEEPFNSSHIRQENLLSKRDHHHERVLDSTEVKPHDNTPLFFDRLYVDPEPLFSIERDHVLGLGDASGRSDPETTELTVDIGPMKDFWRQNKLY